MQLKADPHEEQFWKLADLQLRAALVCHAAASAGPTPATAYNLLEHGPTVLVGHAALVAGSRRCRRQWGLGILGQPAIQLSSGDRHLRREALGGGLDGGKLVDQFGPRTARGQLAHELHPGN